MTAEAEAVSAAELSSLPTCTLSADQLGDLELLLTGALAPLTGFMASADAAGVADGWRLADGTPFPVQITLDLPADCPRQRRPTGSCWPIRRARRSPSWRSTSGSARPGGLVRLAGPVAANRPPEHGPFRRLMLSPAETRAAARRPAGARVRHQGSADQPTDRPASHLAGQLSARAHPAAREWPGEVVGSPQALIGPCWPPCRACHPDSLVVPVPLPQHAERRGQRRRASPDLA